MKRHANKDDRPVPENDMLTWTSPRNTFASLKCWKQITAMKVKLSKRALGRQQLLGSKPAVLCKWSRADLSFSYHILQFSGALGAVLAEYNEGSTYPGPIG